MSGLREFVGSPVKILTSDGRLFVGNLEGYDQNTNVVLTMSTERAFSSKASTQEKSIGGVVIRGDDVICVGSYDGEIEKSTDYTKIFAEELKDTKNPLK
ncbi:hypothetical protein PICMEDRAFT_33877 [Pichia membranifaciens NRRL Y-2026]|uniref:LSM2-LSM8 complex subunit LSM8 n=1 Tax=Pichia membranifaciens NRRL Y-2026 TaxID=763406 RepID=A0A1E3NKL7_9ASCO|nr:hypothetical protein PICMEDRAFT_33877 [Pichia membranifaciens NRRL Y-2026]ODQ46661.1 hypothetical protein PICMEDRAFT_33877 [Pichia membranifaciens NRRL Y-2026]